MTKKEKYKELFLLLKNEVETTPVSGMCVAIIHLHLKQKITLEERKMLQKFLELNKPFKLEQTHPCWFPVYKKEPRINWINEQIKIM